MYCFNSLISSTKFAIFAAPKASKKTVAITPMQVKAITIGISTPVSVIFFPLSKSSAVAYTILPRTYHAGLILLSWRGGSSEQSVRSHFMCLPLSPRPHLAIRLD